MLLETVFIELYSNSMLCMIGTTVSVVIYSYSLAETEPCYCHCLA